MAVNRRKQDDKNLEILRELISINGNKYCFECNQRGPTYVNTTIGSFVCSKCSGMLRGLTPPHRVKSISMATFTPGEIELIKARGNDYCKRVWLGLYDGESVNITDEQSIRDFMSDKYEKKRFYLESNATCSANGNIAVKNKSKTTSNTLISISPLTQNSPSSRFNGSDVYKVINSLLPKDNSCSTVKPASTSSQTFINNTSMNYANSIPTSIPDFPVDFSKAEIYNSAHYNNTQNNNVVNNANVNLTFNDFNSPASASNDRYAALADLDLALRQQNLKSMEENSNVNSKNPFQSSSGNDLFSSKNPFVNGGWNSNSPMPVNPFKPPMNNGVVTNSKNPFL